MKANEQNKINEWIKQGRTFRKFSEFEVRALTENNEMYVEGYAAKFDNPTVMYEYDGVQYKEMIQSGAFSKAKMDDVIFNYNHSGKVVARTRNNTLTLTIDTVGLYIRARLDGTDEGRKLYDEISKGYIDRMSFAFTVEVSEYDKKQHLRTIKEVNKLYDVSAVDIPAYDDTEISARSFFELAKDEEIEDLAKAEKRRRLLLITEINLEGNT